MAYILFTLLCFVWGSSFILIDRVLDAFGPVAVGIGRLLGGTVALAVIWWLRRPKYCVTRSDLLQITFVTFVATMVPFVVLPYVVSQGFGHSYMGMMLSIVPLATIVISVPMLGIWPTRRQLTGVVGGLICLGFILHDGSQRGMSIGLLALAASVPLTYSFGNTYIKWKLDHVPALPLTTLLLGIAGVMLLPVEFVTPLREYLDLMPPAQPTGMVQAIASLAFLGIVATGLSVLVFIHLVLKQGPLFAGMVTYVVPVLAMLWGAYDHEKITLEQMGAMAGVLAMVALVQYGAAKPHPVAADAVAAPEATHLGTSGAPADGDGNGQPADLTTDPARSDSVN